MTTANQALATTNAGALARPDFIKDLGRGTEGIDLTGLRPPSLKLAQATSDEAKRSEADKYLPGLVEGAFFNSLTGEVYGEDPRYLLIVKPLGHTNTQFDKDRNVIEAEIPDDDPRCAFTEGRDEATGKKTRVRPVATRFENFLILLLHGTFDPKAGFTADPTRSSELMTMSLKGTQLKKGGKLLARLASSKLDTFAHLFRAAPVAERRGANSWWGWRFDAAGWPPEAEYLRAEKFYDQTKNVKIEVPVEGEGGDDHEGAIDAQAAPLNDEDIPF